MVTAPVPVEADEPEEEAVGHADDSEKEVLGRTTSLENRRDQAEDEDGADQQLAHPNEAVPRDPIRDRVEPANDEQQAPHDQQQRGWRGRYNWA